MLCAGGLLIGIAMTTCLKQGVPRAGFALGQAYP
jgi:hypothetical protein